MDLSSANRPFGDSVFRNRLMGTCNCFLVAKSHTKTTLHHGEFKCVHAGQVASSLSDGSEPCQHTQGAVHGFVFRQSALWRLCLQKQVDGNLQLLLGRKQPRKDCVGFTRLGFAMVGLSMYMLAKWPLDCLTVWSHASIHKGLCMDLSSANRPFGDSVFRNRLMGTCNCFLVAKSHTKTRLHHGEFKCVHASQVDS